jgi:phosphoglycolate phosphatase
MKTKAVIFDLDGTLLDSLADIGESMNLVLSEMGFATHDAGAYRAFVGDGVTMLARRALPPDHNDEATVRSAVESMRKTYRGRLTNKTRPYDGIPDLLDRLDEQGVRMAVLSNKPHDLTVALVDSLLGNWPFDPVFGERPAVSKKPDPAGALEIARRLGLEPSAILYVGDTPIDIATAHAAGMPSVGAAWGFRPESELVAAGASTIARAPIEVLQYVR